ncbi:MAG: hypothetical protein V7K57_11710 [Nostoc sp.]
MVAGLSFQLAIAEMAGMTETIDMTEMTDMIDRKLGIWGHRTEQNKW